MLKLYFTLLITILGSIQLVSTNCSDRLLYCFNDKEELLGAIQVNQCWSWSRISCQPCSATTDKKKISYEKYIYQCRYHYPTSIMVLVWDNALFYRFLWSHKVIG